MAKELKTTMTIFFHVINCSILILVICRFPFNTPKIHCTAGVKDFNQFLRFKYAILRSTAHNILSESQPIINQNAIWSSNEPNLGHLWLLLLHFPDCLLISCSGGWRHQNTSSRPWATQGGGSVARRTPAIGIGETVKAELWGGVV